MVRIWGIETMAEGVRLSTEVECPHQLGLCVIELVVVVGGQNLADREYRVVSQQVVVGDHVLDDPDVIGRVACEQPCDQCLSVVLLPGIDRMQFDLHVEELFCLGYSLLDICEDVPPGNVGDGFSTKVVFGCKHRSGYCKQEDNHKD